MPGDRRPEGPQALPKSKEVSLPTDLLAELMAAPDCKKGGPGTRWTPEIDRLLLQFWPIKYKADVARIMGFSETTCRARYRELSGER